MANLFIKSANPKTPIILFSMVVILQINFVYAADIKVVLTGNTADFQNPLDLFNIINSHMEKSNDQDSIVWVLNGDIFPDSYSNEQILSWKTEANKILQLYSKLMIVVNQGDGDWMDSGKGGWKKIRSMDKLLSQGSHSRLHVFFHEGCPGPWQISFMNLEIIVINSQWWNHPFDKPLPTSGSCTIADTDNFMEELEGIFDESKPKNVLILSHYPLLSLGNYGGKFPVSAYLVPPKVAFRQFVGTRKDIVNQRFDMFRKQLLNTMNDYSSIIFASGHELNHSILKLDNNFHINSGALASSSFVKTDQRAILHSNKPGIIEITYNVYGQVDYANLNLDNNLLVASESGKLLNAQSGKSNDTLTGRKISGQIMLQTKVVAGPEYSTHWFRRLCLGQHYRSSWTREVKVPYLNVDTTYGGLKFIGTGGGRETKSLKIRAGNGKDYVFRSVDKNPFRALEYDLRGTVIANVLKDQTSAQQPYGAIAVANLLAKIDILHASPELFVLPDHENLGQFRNSYSQLLGMLEERPSDKIEKSKIFSGAKEIQKSFKMFRKLYDDHNNSINKNEFARARIFDLWIGDWSKHEDNWKWAGFAIKNGINFRPIPRDRDHAFSRSDGIFPWFADREWAMPNLENFGEKIIGLRSLMWQARHLDRFVGNSITKEEWIAAATEIQQSISDSDIDNALRKMPDEIYGTDGEEIGRKLKIRLKDLTFYADKYYTILAAVVDVVGSNKREFFQIVRNADSSVDVTIAGVNENKQQDLSKIYYQRKFFLNETKEIRLFGLNDDDIFELRGHAKRSILVRIVSGGGKDLIIDHSSVSGSKKMTLIYDKGEKSNTDVGTEAKIIKPKDPGLYEYNRNAFTYNTYLPMAMFTYDPFIGAAVHGGVTFTRHNFSKPDFSIKHKLRASISAKGGYEFSYENQIRQVIGSWDFVSGMEMSRPLEFSYFFGVGNDTKKDQTRSSDYYRTQYNTMSAFAGLSQSFWKKSTLTLTLKHERNKGISSDDSFLKDNPGIFGAKRLDMMYVNALLNLDFRDRDALPEHGFRFAFNQQSGHVFNKASSIFSISEMSIEEYLSTHQKNPLTIGFRLGGGFSEGKIPFYKMLFLGQSDDLRGYKRNRFAGRAKAFLNTELRYQLFQTQNTFIPYKIGVRGFYDIGQVWSKGENKSAQYWHMGYGGGFYITPFKEQFAFNLSVGSSKEESALLLVSIGSFFR